MTDLLDTCLPLEVKAACRGYPAPLRARMAAALGCVLGDGPLSGDSKLTGDGYRLELAFATASSEARWTADPVAPGPAGLPPMEAARRSFLRLGIDPQALTGLEPLGLGRSFAWVGGRQGATGDRWKLYCDIPQAGLAAADLRERLGLPQPALVPPARPRMAAIDPVTGEGELYYRTTIYAQQLEALLAPCGMADQAEPMRRRIARESGRTLGDRLPGGDIGISYAARGGRVVPTVYLFARALWGTDAAVRRRWLARSDVTEEARAAYRDATAGMAGRRSPRARHAMAGFHCDGSRIALSLGVRPEPLA